MYGVEFREFLGEAQVGARHTARGGAAAAWERGVVVVGAAGERKPVWSESRCRPWASA